MHEHMYTHRAQAAACVHVYIFAAALKLCTCIHLQECLIDQWQVVFLYCKRNNSLYHAAMRSELARIERFYFRRQIIPEKIKSRDSGLKSLYGETLFSAPVFRERPSINPCRYAVGNGSVLNFSVISNRE